MKFYFTLLLSITFSQGASNSMEGVQKITPHEEWVKSYNETIKEYGRLSDFQIPCIKCNLETTGANIESIVCNDCKNTCHVCKTSDKDQDDGMPPISMLQCSRCKIAFYCSKECQKKDWPLHKDFCIISDTIKGKYVYAVTVGRECEDDYVEDEKEDDSSEMTS